MALGRLLKALLPSSSNGEASNTEEAKRVAPPPSDTPQETVPSSAGEVWREILAGRYNKDSLGRPAYGGTNTSPPNAGFGVGRTYE